MRSTIPAPIDWEARFRAPRTLWARVAPGDPTRGLIASSRTGVYQLHRWSVRDGDTTPVTDDPTGITNGLLSPDGRWIAWHADTAGSESGAWVTVRWEGGETRPVAPGLPDSFSFTAAYSPGGRWFATPCNEDGRWRVLVVAWGEDGSGAVREVDPGPGFVSDVAVDDDGTVAFTTTGAEHDLATRVHIVGPDGTLRHEVRQDGAVTTVSFAPDGTGRLLAATMETGWQRPLIVDHDGRASRFPLDAIDGDLRPTAWSRDGAEVLLLGSMRSTTRLFRLAVADGVISQVPHPAGALAIGSSPSDAAMSLADGRLLTTLEDGTAPPRVVALDAVTGLAETLLEAPAVPRSRPWQSIDIPSTDDAVVQGWLATPGGSPPYATIIDIHGGPADQENDRFAPANQAWLDRGYAVLMLNYRGSTGFGRAFESAIWGDPGRRELDDLVAAREALIGMGVADPGAIVATGGSYGGYLTLLALTHRPSLWAAGVAYVAIADWTLMWEDGEALREYQHSLFGGSPADRPAIYAEASPITRVADLRAPLLVVQGRSDPRCPPRQLERFADAARAMGRPVEVDWFDAGHGHGGAAERIAWQRRAMAFVDAALGRD